MNRCGQNVCVAVLSACFLLGAFHPRPVVAQTSTAIQTQEANATGVAADLIECKREGSVLTIRLRFRNTSRTEKAEIRLIRASNGVSNYDAYYVTAGSKKYFVLRDSEGKALAPQADSFSHELNASIDKGGSYVWYARYPAPPADVKMINYYTPVTPPFDNVPIKD